MQPSQKIESDTITYCGLGTTSRQKITVQVKQACPGHGIVFELANAEGAVSIPAHVNAVTHTLRNVVLGQGKARLCIVEHFLAATSLYGLSDLQVKVDGPEMPLGDGSAKCWLDLFVSHNWPSAKIEPTIDLPQTIVCKSGDKLLLAIPDERFSVSYHIDWNHPLIGRRWQTWDVSCPINEVGYARTFSTMAEHQMLGLGDDALSLTVDGFSKPLRFEDEPIRHKLLDLIGDLTLCGVNPLAFKARFVSIKGGHELDVQMAKALVKYC